MATIPNTLTPLPEPGNPPIYVAQWGPMANGDVGLALQGVWNYADRSVQVEGTFGSGGTCAVEGSNDQTNYRMLNDPQGNALSINAASVKAVVEICQNIRPHVIAGDGTTSLTVTMILRRTTPKL